MQKVACGTGRDRGTARGPRNRAPVIWGQEGPWAKTQALGVAEAARPWSSSWRPPGLPRPPSSDHWGSVSSAPSHIRGCPRAGRTSAGPREWPWLDAPSRGSRVLLLRSALAASLDCVVGVGDVGLFGGQHWRERRGSQESEASFSTRPRAHTARRGTRSAFASLSPTPCLGRLSSSSTVTPQLGWASCGERPLSTYCSR